MNSLRRWLYRPKRSDPSLLAQFYFADEELNLIAAELDGFEGRKNPERCATLVNQLRTCQARVLNIVSQMMDESIKDQRAPRDFRVKFPDDVIQENLAGQLWFGAECLAAGSSIMNREVESACMRPLARALTKNLDSLRTILREQCLHNVDDYTDLIKENLIIFDKLFAEFELSYVSAMVSVKTAHEYDMVQEVTVLFSETVQRALKVGLLTQEMIDEYDPALMFTIPRLAIICGVLIFKDGPLNPDNDPWNISEMFRPFQTLLLKIRELLSILTVDELNTLQRALCSQDEPSFLLGLEEKRKQSREERRKQKKEKKGGGKAKNKRQTDGDTGSIDSELTAKEIAERLEALALSFEASHNSQYLQVAVDQSNSTAGQGGSNSKTDDITPPTSIKSEVSESVDNTSRGNRLANDLGLVEDLYWEANLDSSEIISVSPSAYPRDESSVIVSTVSITTQQLHTDNTHIDVDSHSLSSLIHPNIDNDESSFSPNESCENQDEVLDIRSGLNKCDSRDSGLQSEVVSNSGSMFTISSSDSNQQILSSDSIPNPSDQNCTDSNSEDADSHDLLLDVKASPQHAQLENSSDSSATIVTVMTSDTTIINDVNDLGSVDSSESSRNKTPFCRVMQSSPHLVTSSLCDSGDTSCLSIIDGTTIDSSSEDETSGSSSQASVNVSADQNVLSCSPHNMNHVDVNAVINVGVNEDFSSQTVPIADCATRTDNVINSNHSQASACDTTKPEHTNICKSNDPVSGHTIMESQQGEEAGHHQSSHVNKDSIVVNPVGIDSNESDAQSTNSDSRKSSVSSRENTSDCPAQNNISSSNSTGVFGDSTSFGLNLMPENPTTVNQNAVLEAEWNEPSSTHQEEISQSSELIGKARNDDDSSPVAKIVTCHHKGTTTVKNKICKRRNKNNDRRSRRSESSSSSSSKPYLCPHHAKMLREVHQHDHYNSSDTSSYTSECGDQEEIALAIEAAESATRNHVRARFKNSSDMIHRLFVCISGVADQLQTNFAGDLRNILRCVFDMNCPDPMDMCDSDKPKDTTPLGAAYRAMSHTSRAPRHRHSSLRRDPPAWVPDEQSNECMACQVPFNFLRRRHHCRNCGKIFCGRCSSNFVPLPHFGQDKAVRVCNRCFMFQVTPFTNE